MVSTTIITRSNSSFQFHRLVDPLPYQLRNQQNSLKVACPISPGLGTENGSRREKHPSVCGTHPRGQSSLVLFNIYMHPLGQLVWSLGLDYHQYTEDTQLLFVDGWPARYYPSYFGQEFGSHGWMVETNPAKTELIKDDGSMALQGGTQA